MKNIENCKKEILQNFAKKYEDKNVDKLKDYDLLLLDRTAEWWAYMLAFIPDGFEKYSIFDFTGCAVNKKDNSKKLTIPKQVAALAKDKICRFCWGMSWKSIYKRKMTDPSSINVFLQNKSIMLDRMEYGNNIIIHGQSDQPIGRTMLASIAMKEAMRLRVTKFTRTHSYDWVDYSKLFQAIEQDTGDHALYKSCTWLVVDNIIKKPRSDRQTTLMSDLIDPFFTDRFRNKQPTILVFKFDIRDKMFNLEKYFGSGIVSMIDSKRTFKIPLSENLLSDYNE